MQMGSRSTRNVCLKHLKTGGVSWRTLISELEMPNASAFGRRGGTSPFCTHPLWSASWPYAAMPQTILMPHDMADPLVSPPIYKPLDPPLVQHQSVYRLVVFGKMVIGLGFCCCGRVMLSHSACMLLLLLLLLARYMPVHSLPTTS